MKLPKSWPKVVERGHSVVKIYRTPSNGCDQFTTVYYLGEKRIRKTFANYGLAFTDAETVATKLSEGELNVVELKGQDRLAYVRAVEAIKPTGIPLEMAALIFAESFRILKGAKHVEAAEFYAKVHPSNLPQKTVPEVVDELIEAKEADRLSDVYVKDLRGRLRRFQEAFPGKMSLVTAADIEKFVRELKAQVRLPGGKVQYRPASPKLRNHYRAGIGTLFYFAEARGYVPKGLVDIESVAMAKRTEGEIQIFRVEELVRLLNAADPALIPFLTIGAFAGLRHAEIQRLDWTEVRLDDGFIEVKAGKAKTASRRLVPITPNLREWLLPHREAQGPVTSYANMSKQLMWLAAKVDKQLKAEGRRKNEEGTSPGLRQGPHPASGHPLPSDGRGASPQGGEGGGNGGDGKRLFRWKHNALRHSFISYRVADIQNVAQTALEAGNSPRMVFSNYRELVRPADAKRWFALVPGKDGKIVQLPLGKEEGRTQNEEREVAGAPGE